MRARPPFRQIAGLPASQRDELLFCSSFFAASKCFCSTRSVSLAYCASGSFFFAASALEHGNGLSVVHNHHFCELAIEDGAAELAEHVIVGLLLGVGLARD